MNETSSELFHGFHRFKCILDKGMADFGLREICEDGFLG